MSTIDLITEADKQAMLDRIEVKRLRWLTFMSDLFKPCGSCGNPESTLMDRWQVAKKAAFARAGIDRITDEMNRHFWYFVIKANRLGEIRAEDFESPRLDEFVARSG